MIIYELAIDIVNCLNIHLKLYACVVLGVCNSVQKLVPSQLLYVLS